MDLSVQLPGVGVTRVSVPGTARVSNVMRIVYQEKGLSPIAEKLAEFSLAKKGASDCIDVVWLDPVRPLQDQGPLSETLVLKKKYFVRNDELQLFDASEVLLRVLFTQLLQSFKAGLFKCSVFQAAQIVATALKVQQGAVRGSPEPSISDEDLKGILPEHLYQTAGMDQLVTKAMKTLRHISVQEAQKRFIAKLQKLEAFGMAFYSAEYDGCSGFLGIGPDTVCCIEREGMETFNQWDRSDLSSFVANDTSFTMVFGTDEPVTIATTHGHAVSDFMKGLECLQLELKFSSLPTTKPELDQVDWVSKTSPATKSTVPGPPPERPPPRRPIPVPRSGRVFSVSGDPSNPPPSKEEGKGPQPKEEGKGPQPKEEGKGPQPKEEGKGPQPKEEGKGPQPKEEGKGPQPKEEGKGPQPKEEGKGPQPKEEGKGPQPKEEGKGPQPKEEGKGPQSKEEGKGPQPKEEGKGFPPKARGRLASSSADIGATVVAKGTAVQPDKHESPAEAYEPTPVAYLEPKRSIHRIPATTTAEPVFGMFQKKAERPSMYAVVRDSVDDLSIILDSDLSSELSISAEENPIYDANASEEVEICIRSCNATYKALNQSFKQSVKAKGQRVKATPPPIPPPPHSQHPANGGQPKKVPLLPPAPNKPPPPHKPPPIFAKGGVNAKQNSAEAQPNSGSTPAVVGGTGPAADVMTPHPFHVPSKPKITKVSVSKATEEVCGGVYLESLAKRRSMSVNKDTRPSPNIADKVEGTPSSRVLSPVRREMGDKLNAIAENRMSKKSNSISEMRPPKPPRAKKKAQSDDEVEVSKQPATAGGCRGHSDEEWDVLKQPVRTVKARGSVLDAAILLREYCIFFVKLPNGHLYTELENIKAPLKKMLYRLCALVQAEDCSQYSLYVEGAALNRVAGKEEGGEATFDAFSENACILLPEQEANAVLLDPEQSLYKQGVHSTRILALRKNAMWAERLRLEPPCVPEWVQFYKYSTGIVQGVQPCSLHDAVKLAALHYQVCILDRTEMNSVIELCSAEDLVSYEYSLVRGIADKIHAEHLKYRGYTLKQAQENYIQICQGLPTHNTIFFPCKEVKQRALMNNKLTPILIGINQDGVVRVDPKTKEILDIWPYQVIQNWAFGSKTFMLHFADSSYPVKTNQGNWMTELIDFNVESIVNKPKPEPGLNRNTIQNYEQDPNLTERLYEELLCVAEPGLGEYDVLQHFPAHNPPGTFPSSGDYEPVEGGGMYSTISAGLMDNNSGGTFPNEKHEYEEIKLRHNHT